MLETAIEYILELPKDLDFPFDVMVLLLTCCIIGFEYFFLQRVIIGNFKRFRGIKISRGGQNKTNTHIKYLCFFYVVP